MILKDLPESQVVAILASLVEIVELVRSHNVREDIHGLQSIYNMFLEQKDFVYGLDVNQFRNLLLVSVEKARESFGIDDGKKPYKYSFEGTLIDRLDKLERRAIILGRNFNLHKDIKPSNVIGNLLEYIPENKPAPIHTSIINNRLEIVNPKHIEGQIQEASIGKLRQTAGNILRRAIKTMREANVDRRVVSECEALLRDLETEYDQLSIEGLGLDWELVSDLLERFKDSIPEIAIVQLEHALRTISVIINQFEEWRTYLDAKTAMSISSAEAESMVAEISSLPDDLSNSEFINPKIGQRLQEIIVRVTDSFVRVDSITAPLVGSLSNIFAGLSRAVIDLGIQLEPLVHTIGYIGKGPAFGLFCVALLLLRKYVPILERLPQLAFMRDAYEFTTKHFAWAKDIIFK